MTNRLCETLLNGFFPGRCLCCELPSGRALDLCAACEAELPTLGNHCRICAEPLPVQGICGHCLDAPPDFFRILAPFRYASPLSELITALKHGGDLSAGRTLGALLARHVLDPSQEVFMPQVLLPMPLHWRRLWARGFNQAGEIARVVAADAGIPLRGRLARRVANTPMQQQLDRRLRQRNLRGAFAAAPACANLHIAVIDDVVTTASSARALATALMGAGAASVQIWCLARTALEK